MLIKTGYANSNKSSVYRCDMCNIILIKERDTFYNVLVQNTSNKKTQKKWDLCSNCFRLLELNIMRRKEQMKL